MMDFAWAPHFQRRRCSPRSRNDQYAIIDVALALGKATFFQRLVYEEGDFVSRELNEFLSYGALLNVIF